MFNQSFFPNVPVEVSWNHIILDAFIVFILFNIYSVIFYLIFANTCEKWCCLLTNDRSVCFLFVFCLSLCLNMNALSFFSSVFLNLFDDFLSIKTKVIVNCIISLISIFNCNKIPKLTFFVVRFNWLFIKCRLKFLQK